MAEKLNSNTSSTRSYPNRDPASSIHCHQPLSKVNICHRDQKCWSKGTEKIMLTIPSGQKFYTPHSIHVADTTMISKSPVWMHTTEPNSQLLLKLRLSALCCYDPRSPLRLFRGDDHPGHGILDLSSFHQKSTFHNL